MPDHSLDDEPLVVVAERPTEVGGQLLVQVLADAGIKATADGWHTASFRAETPGMVQIRCFAKDADRAKQVIAEIRPAGQAEPEQ